MSNSPLSLAAVVTKTDPAHLPGPEPLTGQHVLLERLTQKHFSDLYETTGPSHHDLWVWWPDDAPSTASEFDKYLNHLLKMSDDILVYAVFPLHGENKTKTIASGLGFVASEDRLTNRVAELGAFFGPQLQRSRAGTEAIYLLSNLMFELNHRRLGWKTNALNIQSRRAAERYGFIHEGTLRQHQINKGRNRDTAWYGIIDSEWPLCKEAFERWLKDENFDERQQQRRRLEEIRDSLK
jgi:RimJ/RimL family protein N-acetyltransferase